MGGIKPQQVDEPDNPFVDQSLTQDEFDNPFVDRQVATLEPPKPKPESRVVTGAKAFGRGALGFFTGFPHAIVDLAKTTRDALDAIDPRNPFNKELSATNKEKFRVALEHIKSTMIDPVTHAVGTVARSGLSGYPKLEKMYGLDWEHMSDDEFKQRLTELGGVATGFTIGGEIIGRTATDLVRGFPVKRAKGEPGIEGVDVGPAPPGTLALTGEVRGPGAPPSGPGKGAPPTPEQMIERQARLDAMKKQGEQVAATKAQQRQTKADVTKLAKTLWTKILEIDPKDPTVTQRAFPGLVDEEYGRQWDELTPESQEILKRQAKQIDVQERASTESPSGAPAARGEVLPEAPLAQPAPEQPPAGLPVNKPVETVAEPSPYEGLPKGPPLPDVNAIQQRTTEEAKAAYEQSRKQTGIQSGIPTELPADPNARMVVARMLKEMTPEDHDYIAKKIMRLPPEVRGQIDDYIDVIERSQIKQKPTTEHRMLLKNSAYIEDIVDQMAATDQLIQETGGSVPPPINQRGEPMALEPLTPPTEPTPLPTPLVSGEPSQTTPEPTLEQQSLPAPSPRPEGPPSEDAVAIARATVKRLEKQLDDLDDAVDSGEITEEQYNKALAENTRLRSAAALLIPEIKTEALNAPLSLRLPDTMGKDLSRFTSKQLSDTKKFIISALNNLKLDEAQRQTFRDEFNHIAEYETTRKPQDEGGFLSIGSRKVIQKAKFNTLTPSEQYMSKRVIVEPDLYNPINWIKLLRKMYMGFFRPSESLNLAVKIYEAEIGERVPAHKHPGKEQEMMDGALTQVEGWLRGDGPYLPDGQGGFERVMLPDRQGNPVPVKSLAGIAETANNDIERLGYLWAAARALDVMAKKNKDLGVDLGHAAEIYRTYPENLHDAVHEGNNFGMANALLAHREGLLSQESITGFAEESAYGPIQRLFDEKYMKSIVAEMKVGGKSAKSVLGKVPFYRLKGSDLPMVNMFENMITVTYRIHKAAKLNRFALDLVDLARKQPDLFRGMIEPAGHKLTIVDEAETSARSEVVKAMFEDVGIDISNENANLFANMLSDNAINVEGGVIRVINDGKVELWRVDSMLAESIRSMAPVEHMFLMKAMGAGFKIRNLHVPGVAHILRLGIVLDPAFMAMQILIDQYQGFVNTKYGFVPVYDTFRGWWHLVSNSEIAREALRAGGVERGGLRPRVGLAEVIAGPNLPTFKLAHQQIITFHPFKAMSTLIAPVREATRMGEYLRARGRGATPIQAAWSARDLLGNYSVEGTFATVRALNYISAFGRPAMAVIDKTGRTIYEQPGRWFIGGTLLALAAALLYAANYKDEDIRRARQTPGGQRWFFFRIGNKIYQTRKPYGEGAIFASGMEAMLDLWYQKNPDAVSLWAKSILNEFKVNMLPVMGVMGYELMSNKSFQTGADIIPEEQMKLDREYHVGPYAGTAERMVGEATGLSPAVLNYVARGFGGYLGESSLRAISAAIDWRRTGELPPAEDWPLTQRILARYPSYNTQPLRKFYETAGIVDRAATTLDMVYATRPDRIEVELNQHKKILPLIETFNQARQQIADLRRSSQQLDDIQDIGPKTKKTYRDAFLRQMIEIAQDNNLIADAILNTKIQAPIQTAIPKAKP